MVITTKNINNHIAVDAAIAAKVRIDSRFLFHVHDKVALKKLLEYGLDANVEDTHGQTPLFYANNAWMMAALVRHGANINHQANDGSTALLTLCRNMVRLKNNPYHRQKIEYLLRNGANPNICNHAAQYPLQHVRDDALFWLMVEYRARTDIPLFHLVAATSANVLEHLLRHNLHTHTTVKDAYKRGLPYYFSSTEHLRTWRTHASLEMSEELLLHHVKGSQKIEVLIQHSMKN